MDEAGPAAAWGLAIKTRTTLHAPPARPGAPVIRPDLSTPSIPPDLLAHASRRLKWVCLVYGMGFLVAYGLLVLLVPGFTARRTFPVEAAIAVISIVSALGVFAAAATGRIRPVSLLDLGLLFEVVGGLGISLVEQWGFFDGGSFKVFGISWVCVWIVIFPLIVPGSPAKTLLAAAITATTGPLAYTASTAFYGGEPQPFGVLLSLFLPLYIAAAIAFLGAKVVYRLGQNVREARRMGAYELVERLGAGGMGEVWRARHRFLSRPAAIKLIRPEAMGLAGGAHLEDLQQRFEREAQATATLRSPHSIILYDFGVTDAGVFYYVMELLSGMDLRTMVTRFGSVPANRAVHLLKQVCRSLIDAHDNGLIHRDVKPANIYICRLGAEYDFVKVLDFGLVKSLRPERPETTLTRGAVTGSPGYIPPEVVLGADPANPRTDVYSLGCVAYWLLTGGSVFAGATTEEVLRAHMTREPEPPSSRSELPIPGELDRLVLASLAKDPQDRIPDAARFLELLEAVEIDPPWTGRNARLWWEKNAPEVLQTPVTG